MSLEHFSRIVRLPPDGRITIPCEFRRQLGVEGETQLEITLSNGELRLRPLRTPDPAAGSAWLKDLYDLLAPVREAATRYREEEINATIDAAIRATRGQS